MSFPEFAMRAWEWKPSVIVGCSALASAYLASERFRFPRRAALWMTGVLLIFVALASPVDVIADSYLFSIHMAKHILFVLVIPALLLMGTPPVWVERLLSYRYMARAERMLARPAVSWSAGIGAMALWHIPALFNAASSHEALHIAEHLSLLVAGTVYWWPILSPLPWLRLAPVPQSVAYLFTSCAACTTMGVLITFAPHSLYPAYAQPHDVYGILPVIREQWGVSAAMDQQIGGLLMWVPGCIVYLTAIMAMFARWYGAEPEAAVEAS
jgi:cytochrome c oxidase assembly factor CtaG